MSSKKGRKREGKFKNFIRGLRDGDCFHNYFRLDFSDPDCATSSIHSLFGLQAILQTLPQIYAVFSSGSGDGLNIYSTIMNALISTLQFTYMIKLGDPFEAWFAPALIATQQISLPVMIYYYDEEPKKAAGVVVGYAATVLILTCVIPQPCLAALQHLEVPLVIVSTVLQVYTNYKSESTGSISILSRLMALAGSAETLFMNFLDYWLDEEGSGMSLFVEGVRITADAVLVAQYAMINGLSSLAGFANSD